MTTQRRRQRIAHHQLMHCGIRRAPDIDDFGFELDYEPETEMSQATGEDMDEVFQFIDKSCCSNIVANFHRQRLDGQFLDVTLKAGETTIVAHRSFLAAFAEYFERLFASGMLESTLKEIELKDIDGPTLALIVDFAYSGHIDIMPGNVSSILEMANYLGVEVLKNACCKYLWKHVNFENALDVMVLASRYHCSQLYDQTKCYLVERFQRLATSSSFQEMDDKVLLDLVSDDRLVFVQEGFCVSMARQELLVLESVLHYIQHDETKRIGLLGQFLSSAVRLSLIPREMIIALRQNFAGFPKLTDALDVAMSEMPDPIAVSLRKRGLRHDLDRRLADSSALHTEQSNENYDDSQEPVAEARYVTGMTVYVRRWDGRPVIGGLKIQYNSGQVVQVGGDAFPSGSCHEFLLEQNERIVRATVRAGWMVDQLTFYTNRNRQIGPYGGPGGGEYNFDYSEKTGTYLAGIQCRVDYTESLPSVRHFRLVWAKFTYTVNKQ